MLCIGLFRYIYNIIIDRKDKLTYIKIINAIAIFRNKQSLILIYVRRPTSGLLESDSMRIVITAPDKDLLLQQDDVAFMLVQYEESEDEHKK